MLRPSVVFPLLLLVGCGTAVADHNRYKWRDAQGNLHYSDSLPAEAARMGYEVVNSHGIVIKRVDRAKTKEELAQAKLLAERRKAEREAAEIQARTDAQLLAGYASEADLTRSQRLKTEMLDQQINAARISLRNQEQTLADLLGRAAEVERSGQALPPAKAEELATIRKQVDEQRQLVERRVNERAYAEEQFEKELARYRELKAKQQAARGADG